MHSTARSLAGWLIVATAFAALGRAAAEEQGGLQTMRLRVTGLFSPDREADFKAALEKLPEVTLASVDFATAEAVFEFDPQKAFPGAKPEQLVEQFDTRLRSVTRQTFGVRALCTVPREKLKVVKIPIVGLDCKACSLAAYEAVYGLDGVEQATASFKDGLVTAWIDPEKTDQAPLEAALKQRGVTLKE